MDDAAAIAILLAVLLALALWTRQGHAGRGRHRTPPSPAPRPPASPRPPAGAVVRPPDPARAPPVLQGPAYVVDGDSLVIGRTQVRLHGVDAPELNHPYGQKAKWALVALCKGKVVRAETIGPDAYGRMVARCSLPDGRDLSAAMVQAGLAIDWARFSGGAYRAMEVPGIRKRLWLADARQRGRMDVWERYEAQGDARRTGQATRGPTASARGAGGPAR